MKSEERARCLNELLQLVTSNKLKFSDIGKVSEGFFSKYIDILHVGKIEIVSNAPQSIYERKKIQNKIIAYCGDSVSDEFIVKESEEIDADKGNSNVLIYPIEGYSFNKDEIDFVVSIVSLFHLYFSKKKLEDLIVEARYKDALTNILNMSGLNKFFYQNESPDKYVYIFSNIKSFKYINNIYDRKNADIILKKYTEKLSSIMDEDEKLCRPGGDNFISVVKKEKFKEYLNLLEHVIIEFSGNKIDLYSTIGYYENEKNISPSVCIEFANTAYTVAKRKNVNIFKYTDELNKLVINEKGIKVEVINALKNNELVNYYQPKVNCIKNELYGAEALVRWNKDGRLILPMVFIQILEKENMIMDLDYYVLKKACEDIKKWQNLDLDPVKVSVNFSVKHLECDDTVNNVIKIIEEVGIDPKYIEIELTELTNIEDMKKTKKFIRSLQENNISVSMDDFGSGYSSITLLKNLNYDIVKIDKALIDSLENNNKKDLIILRNIISMLKELEIDVVAEGVESKKQLDILRDCGCNIIQGYYYDKPIEEKEFVKRLENKKYEING